MKKLSPPINNDSILIKKLNRGDKKAYTILYDKYVGMVHGYILSILKDAILAEDLTQYCFMQIWIHRGKISAERNFPAYLYVIARNAAYKELRRQLVSENYINHIIKGGG